jgi:hypothetical protein
LEESKVWENRERGESKTTARRRERDTTRMLNNGFTDKTTISFLFLKFELALDLRKDELRICTKDKKLNCLGEHRDHRGYQLRKLLQKSC